MAKKRKKRKGSKKRKKRSKKGWSPAKVKRYKAARRRLINQFNAE